MEKRSDKVRTHTIKSPNLFLYEEIPHSPSYAWSPRRARANVCTATIRRTLGLRVVFRLWHRVLALTAVATLLAVASLLVVQQQVFRRGLLDYVNRLDLQRAQGLAGVLAGEFREYGSWERLRRNPIRYRWLLDQGLQEGRGFGTPPPEELPRGSRGPPGRPGFDRMRPDDGGGRSRDQLGPRPPPPGFAGSDPDALRRRFAIYDAQGEPVIGPKERWAGTQEIPIVVDGSAVGQLALKSLPRLESTWDLQFAREQGKYGLLSALAVLALATLGSMVFARRLAEPLRRMADRAKRIAAGDYTARVDIQRSDEIGELATELDAMAVALERNRAARQRWTAEISHELRTPLSVIRAELDALEDGVRPLDRAALRSLSGEAQRLSHLVEDLYQLALADAGALAYRFSEQDLVELIRESLDAHASSFALAGLRVDCDLPAAAPVRADPERVRQLFASLCANSCRYTSAEGQVRVRLTDAGAHWKFELEDSKPGVPDDALAHLFDPLYRVEASRSRSEGGAGLGLAIVRRIAEAHSASIRAEHSALGGLRIVIEWPKVVTRD